MALSIKKRNLSLEAQYRVKVHIPKALSSMLSEMKKKRMGDGGRGEGSRHMTNLKEEIITNTNVSFQHLTSQNKSVSI